MFCDICSLHVGSDFHLQTLTHTPLKITRVQHGFDMMSLFFAKRIAPAAHPEWAHQNERHNN